jgi:hypothetical protein
MVAGSEAVDQEASTQPLEKVDLIEVEDSRPHMAAGEINVTAAPEPAAAAVPSVVIDSPSTPSILVAPPPTAEPAAPVPIMSTKPASQKSSGPQHPRKPTPQPVGGKRKKTAPPVATFSDAEEAFFAAGTKLAQSDEPEAESFDDLDEGLNLPQTFWKRLFRSPNTSIDPNQRGPRRPGPRKK